MKSGKIEINVSGGDASFANVVQGDGNSVNSGGAQRTDVKGDVDALARELQQNADALSGQLKQVRALIDYSDLLDAKGRAELSARLMEKIRELDGLAAGEVGAPSEVDALGHFRETVSGVGGLVEEVGRLARESSTLAQQLFPFIKTAAGLIVSMRGLVGL